MHEEEMKNALLQELDHYASIVGGRELRSIFFGGGTPSLMSASTVEAVIDRAANKFNATDTIEITLEANPTSVEASKFADFAQAGVNRVSLGIQALNDEDLKALGREHSADEALGAIELSQKYFKRSNFDLIYARIDQKLDDWKNELERAIQMANGHLSLYQLTIEMGTPFYGQWQKGELIIPEEDLAAEMYDLTNEVCAAAGYGLYEISNYAKAGEESRHNLTYWNYKDYVGIGPGAHGRITIDDCTYATMQYKKPETWLKACVEHGQGTKDKVPLDDQQMAEEMIMMGLRLEKGVSASDFENRVGRPITDFLQVDQLDLLKAQGFFVSAGPDQYQLSASGRTLLNQILGHILV